MISLSDSNKALIALLAFLVIYLYFTFSGYYFYDDYGYAQRAYQLLDGSFQLQSDSFSHRFGFFAPIACIYALLGITDFSTILWPVACTIGTVVLLFVYLRLQPIVCWYAIAATALNSYFIFFIDKVYPDTAVTFFLLLAAILAERYRHRFPTKAGFSCICFLFFAFLTKETAIYTFPFFAGLLLYEYFKGGASGKQFATVAFLTGILLFTSYLALYTYYTGHPLYRFISIIESHYVFAGNYIDKSSASIIRRLTYEPWLMFLDSGLLVAILPGIVMAVYLLLFAKSESLSRYKFWAWFTLVIATGYWFLSTSTRYYTPLPLSPRMYFALLAPSAILAGLFWQKAEQSPRVALYLSLLFTPAILYSLYIQSKYAPIYLGLAIIPWVCRMGNLGLYLARALFVGLLLSVPLYRMISPQQWGYQAEKHFFNTYLSSGKGQTLVITDERLAASYDWYNQFSPLANYRFINFQTALKQPLDGYDQAWVLFNPYTFSTVSLPIQPWQLWYEKFGKQILLVEEKEGVRLYAWKKHNH
ncbi:MAG: hypothetical protein V4714_12920 [Bacteroidota bacterium]